MAARRTRSRRRSGTGWFDDPSPRFQHRYWNGSSWTDHVSTDGIQANDPSDAGWPPPAPHQASHDAPNGQPSPRRRFLAVAVVVVVVGGALGALFVVNGNRNGNGTRAARTSNTTARHADIFVWATHAESVVNRLDDDRTAILASQVEIDRDILAGAYSDSTAVDGLHLACSQWAEDATELSTTAPTGDHELDHLIANYDRLVRATVDTCMVSTAGIATHTAADGVKDQIVHRAKSLDPQWSNFDAP